MSIADCSGSNHYLSFSLLVTEASLTSLIVGPINPKNCHGAALYLQSSVSQIQLSTLLDMCCPWLLEPVCTARNQHPFQTQSDLYIPDQKLYYSSFTCLNDNWNSTMSWQFGWLSSRLFYAKLKAVYSHSKKYSKPPVSLEGQVLGAVEWMRNYSSHLSNLDENTVPFVECKKWKLN
jgi:hypothetical protein